MHICRLLRHMEGTTNLVTHEKVTNEDTYPRIDIEKIEKASLGCPSCHLPSAPSGPLRACVWIKYQGYGEDVTNKLLL